MVFLFFRKTSPTGIAKKKNRKHLQPPLRKLGFSTYKHIAACGVSCGSMHKPHGPCTVYSPCICSTCPGPLCPEDSKSRFRQFCLPFLETASIKWPRYSRHRIWQSMLQQLSDGCSMVQHGNIPGFENSPVFHDGPEAVVRTLTWRPGRQLDLSGSQWI